MANIGNFNPQQFEPLGEFTAVPKGEWNVVIADSEVDQSNPNDPKLVLHIEFVGGEADGNKAKGGKTDVHLFLWTPGAPSGQKPTKGDISRRKLRSITDALGVYQQFEDTAILHGRPFTVKTDIRWVEKRDNSGYTGFPDIKSFSAYKAQQALGADAVQPQPPTAPAAPAAPSLPAFGAPVFGAPAAPAAPAFSAPAPQQFAAPAMPAAPVATQQAPMAAPGFAPPAMPGTFAPPAAAAPAPVPQQFAPPQFGAPR